jgi:SAM-dependent methyltransferase
MSARHYRLLLLQSLALSDESIMFKWINVDEFKAISCSRIVLFGAGKGTEELIEHIHGNDFDINILGIIDNDKSLWGQRLSDIPVTGVSDLASFDFDRIVVTSISGRDAIACQLEREGYRRPDDFILIGRYPETWRDSYLKFRSALAGHGSVEGKSCLHIGPGGFLGLEVLMYCLGAASVHSIDKNTFGISYPDVTARFDDYLKIRKQLGLFSSDTDTTEGGEARFDSLFYRENGRVRMDPEKISYLYPEDVCSLPFSDDRFDIVVSFAVLEHVRTPDRAAAEISRVLKPDGLSFHRIITADHRSFSAFGGFDAFSFRSCSGREWDEISSRKFYQNRVIPVKWKQLFEGAGLKVENYAVDKVADLDVQRLETFSEEFRSFSSDELMAVNCDMLLKRVAAS